MNQILEEISNIGVVPVVAIDHKDDAAPLADALTKGGLPCAEVTFRTPAAEESIRIMAEQFPDMLLGAGTVLTTEQADRAIAAGAKFIVSPGFNPKVVSHCIEKNIPITPGISSPSDMEQAIEMGLDAVKFFPAVPSGGLSMIKALAAPYHTMRFMPTGGVTPQNLTEFLDYPKILACGGTWMVKPELLATGNFEEITRLTRQTVRTMLDLKIDELTLPFPPLCQAHDKKIFIFSCPHDTAFLIGILPPPVSVRRQKKHEVVPFLPAAYSQKLCCLFCNKTQSA